MTTLQSDDVFNIVEQTYNNIMYLKSFMNIIGWDFSNKVEVSRILIQKPNEKLESFMKKELGKKLKDTAKEILIAERSIVKAKRDLRITGYLRSFQASTKRKITENTESMEPCLSVL